MVSTPGSDRDTAENSAACSSAEVAKTRLSAGVPANGSTWCQMSQWHGKKIPTQKIACGKMDACGSVSGGQLRAGHPAARAAARATGTGTGSGAYRWSAIGLALRHAALFEAVHE